MDIQQLKSPYIRCWVPQLKKHLIMMIDTGAVPNIIKIDAVKQLEINQTKHIQLSGISKEMVSTLGEVNLSILDYDTTFQAVPDDFPLESDGLIGVEFIEKN